MEILNTYSVIEVTNNKMKKAGFLSTSLVCVGLSFASMFSFVLAAPVPDGVTKCQTGENGAQYRCAKDNYHADTI